MRADETAKDHSRTQAIPVGGAFLGTLAIGGIVVVLLSGDWPPELRFMAFGLILVPTAYRLHILWTHRKRMRKLATCDWRRCLFCFFDLRGLPDHGTCPECGEEYDIDDVRDKWKSALTTDAPRAKRD